MKTFNILGVHWRIQLLGGFTKNQYRGENCLRMRGGWTVCQFKGGLARKRGGAGGVFERGIDTPMYTHYDILLKMVSWIPSTNMHHFFITFSELMRQLTKALRKTIMKRSEPENKYLKSSSKIWIILKGKKFLQQIIWKVLKSIQVLLLLLKTNPNLCWFSVQISNATFLVFKEKCPFSFNNFNLYI